MCLTDPGSRISVHSSFAVKVSFPRHFYSQAKPQKGRLYEVLLCHSPPRHVMPVVHDGATDVAQDKPKNCEENCFKCGIHAGKINREDMGVKRKFQSNSKVSCSSGQLHTGANDCRCRGVGPYCCRA